LGAQGWLYRAVVLDLFNREVLGWLIKLRMTVDLASGALTMTWFRRSRAKVRCSFIAIKAVHRRDALQAGRTRHDSIDERQGQLLRQCAHRKLFQ